MAGAGSIPHGAGLHGSGAAAVAVPAVSIRKCIEDGVLALLEPLKAGNVGGYLAVLKPFQGDLTPDSEDPDIARVACGATPAVLVTTAGATYEQNGMMGLLSKGELEVVVLIVSRSLRSREDAARGDGESADPGAYQIMDDVRNALHGNALPECTASPLTPDREDRIDAGDFAVWSQTYTCMFDSEQPKLDAEDGFYKSREIKVQAPAGQIDEVVPIVSNDCPLVDPTL